MGQCGQCVDHIRKARNSKERRDSFGGVVYNGK